MAQKEQLYDEVQNQMAVNNVELAVTTYTSLFMDGDDDCQYTIDHVRVGTQFGIAFVPNYDAYGGGWFVLDYTNERVITHDKIGRLWEAVSYLMDTLKDPSSHPHMQDQEEWTRLFI